MRELKFRAWSNTDKEYNYKVLVGNSDSKDENYTCHSVLVDGDWLHFDEFCGVIEQYTGLKDKNGNADLSGGDGLFLPRGVTRITLSLKGLTLRSFYDKIKSTY